MPRVVIITGASRGLGRAMVEALAQQAMVIAAARSIADHPPPGAALAIPTDVRDPDQVRNLVHRTLDQYGRIDVLVNNAGLIGGDLAFTDTTAEFWQDVLDTNLRGAFLCCQAVVPEMRRRQSGTIVNITSGAAVRTGFLNLPYGVSKAGLDRLTLGLGEELKDDRIACISLSPPVSATATVKRLYPDKDISAWARPPQWTAHALCALLEDDPMQYTGQVVSVREYLQAKGLLEGLLNSRPPASD